MSLSHQNQRPLPESESSQWSSGYPDHVPSLTQDTYIHPSLTHSAPIFSQPKYLLPPPGQLLPSPDQLLASSEIHMPTSQLNQRKIRGKLPKATTDYLKAWLHAHCDHPYPNEAEKKQLCLATGLSMSQVSNWMINARRRILAPARRTSVPDLYSPTLPFPPVPFGNSQSPAGGREYMDGNSTPLPPISPFSHPSQQDQRRMHPVYSNQSNVGPYFNMYNSSSGYNGQ
ncbi:homeobox KN domain-containing protein [Armillaria fumosa]|nr:homeobox KN domain-containing protein [Armillaria fumosa]